MTDDILALTQAYVITGDPLKTPENPLVQTPAPAAVAGQKDEVEGKKEAQSSGTKEEVKGVEGQQKDVKGAEQDIPHPPAQEMPPAELVPPGKRDHHKSLFCLPSKHHKACCWGSRTRACVNSPNTLLRSLHLTQTLDPHPQGHKCQLLIH